MTKAGNTISKGLQTRAAILNAALDIASRDGLEGLSIGMLADALGMSKSGVFAHFGSREDLQIALIDEYARRFMEAVYWLVVGLMVFRVAANLYRPGVDLMAPSVSQGVFFLAVLLLTTAGSFGMFWMEIQYLHVELARQAARDSLTGMLNRGSFLVEFERELARVRRGGTVLSVAMFDLDHFKRLNDTHGHPAGDEVLRSMAASMQASIRQPDILGRYGGEEFALLMPDTDADMAMRVAERIRTAVQLHGVEWNAQRLSITVSGGVAAFASHGVGADALIAAADAALYEAKRAGRNRVLQAAGRPGAAKEPTGIHATS